MDIRQIDIVGCGYLVTGLRGELTLPAIPRSVGLNTFGTRVGTDGERVAPMLPLPSSVYVCTLHRTLYSLFANRYRFAAVAASF